MTEVIQGIHHITAIAGDPQRNLDFYTQVLGLRLVKLTVNFDDPGTYHFYFGNRTGQPGTILTFFPWTNVRRGRRGTGQVSAVSFLIPPDALGYWQERFKQNQVTTSSPFRRFDEEVLTLLDPDGMKIELVASEQAAKAAPGWEDGPVDAAHSLRGFGSPTLLVEQVDGTANLLTGTFGMQLVEQSGPRFRFSSGQGPGSFVDLEARPQETRGQMGAGIIHHIAWRAANDEEQLAWRENLFAAGLNATEVLDRQYFRSIYFREPGGILFEIATDLPGFTVDEPVETLGSLLKLPGWLEPRRADIERILPALKLPIQHQAR